MPDLYTLRDSGMSLEAIRRDTSNELWVFNNSGQLTVGSGRNKRPMGVGIIHINVKLSDNDNRSLIVPNTWVPVNLAEQMEKSSIVSSPDFMQAVRQRAIIVVDSKAANEFFDGSDEESIEACAVYASVSANLMGETNPGIGEEEIRARRSKGRDRNAPVNQKLKAAIARGRGGEEEVNPDGDVPGSEGINPQIVELSQRREIDVDAAYSAIRTLGDSGVLTIDDYEFILNNFNYDKIVKYANDQKSRLLRQTTRRR